MISRDLRTSAQASSAMTTCAPCRHCFEFFEGDRANSDRDAPLFHESIGIDSHAR